MRQGVSVVALGRFFYKTLLCGLLFALSGCDFSSSFWLSSKRTEGVEASENKRDESFYYGDKVLTDLQDMKPESLEQLPQHQRLKLLPVETSFAVSITEPPLLTQQERYLLSQRYATTLFDFLNYYESDDNGSRCIVLNFSVPLNPDQDFTQLITVLDLIVGKLTVPIQLSEDLMSLYVQQLPAERDIILTLSKDLLAINARSLLTNKRVEVVTSRMTSAVGFLSQGTLLPTVQDLPILAANVNAIDINFYKIANDKLSSFFQQWSNSGVLSIDALNEHYQPILSGKNLYYTSKFELLNSQGKRQRYNLPIKEIVELKEPGAYVAVMNETGSYHSINPATLFMVTDIGILLYRYQDHWLVALQSLTTGEALSNIEIKLFNREGVELYRERSDEQGWLNLPPILDATLLSASNDTQITLMKLSPLFENKTAQLFSQPSKTKKHLVLLDPVYTPQQSLQLNGLLYDEHGIIIREQEIRVEVYSPSNELVSTSSLTGINGFYQLLYPLNDQMPLGIWRFVFDLAGVLQEYSFDLTSTLEEIKIQWLNANTDITLATQPLNYHFLLEYADNLPIVEQPVDVMLSVQPAIVFEKYPLFLFGSNEPHQYQRDLNRVGYRTDAYGEFNLNVVPSVYSELFKLPVLFEAEIRVGKKNAGKNMRRVSQFVWPNEIIYGIRPIVTHIEQSHLSFKKQSTIEFEVIAINRTEQQVHMPSLTAKLIVEKSSQEWLWDPQFGWKKEEEKQEITLAQIPVKGVGELSGYFAFPIEQGEYRVELYQEDNLVNQLRFNTFEYHESPEILSTHQLATFPVSLHRTSDTLQVSIANERSAQGFILLESSNNLLFKQRITLVKGDNNYQIPLLHSCCDENSSVAVVLFAADVNSPVTQRYVNIQSIPSNHSDRRQIKAKLDLPDDFTVGQDMTLYLSLKADTLNPLKEVNAQFSFIKKEDVQYPLQHFYANKDWLYHTIFTEQRYQMDRVDMYRDIISGDRLQPVPMVRSLASIASQPKITPLYPVVTQTMIPQLSVNELGIAKVKLPLPSEQGEFYLVGQFWSDSQYGTVLNELNLFEPYNVTVATPSQLFLGDTAELIINVKNQWQSEQKITLAITSQDSPLLFEKQEITLVLPAKRDEVLRFPIPQVTHLGKTTIAVESYLLGEPVANTKQQIFTIPVSSPYPKQHNSYVFDLAVGESWQLSDNSLQSLRPDTAQIDVVLTEMTPLMMLHYVNDFQEIEQNLSLVDKISGVWSWLGLPKDSSQLGVLSPSFEERSLWIQDSIDTLVSLQLDNGGFPNHFFNSQESAWGTVYIADFLRNARQQQFHVNMELWQKLIKRLRSYLTEPLDMVGIQPDYHMEAMAAVRSYAALVLAQEGEVTLPELLALNKVIERNLSGLPMLQLGFALETLGEHSQSSMLLMLGMAKQRSSDSVYLGDYGSNLRDRAASLVLLSQYQKGASPLSNLWLTLSRQVMLRQRLTEVEKTALFFAARDLSEQAQPEWLLELNNNLLLSHKLWQYRFKGEQAVKRGLNMTNKGETSLKSIVYLSGFPKKPPEAIHNTLSIERHIYNMQGELITPSQIVLGDEVAVFITLKSEGALSDVLVEDNFAAGLTIQANGLAIPKALHKLAQGKNKQLVVNVGQNAARVLPSSGNSYRALLDLNENELTTLFFIAQAQYTGEYSLATPIAYSLAKPQHYAWGSTSLQPLKITELAVDKK